MQEYGLLKELDDSSIQQTKAIIVKFGGGYDVMHSTPVFLIDARGQVRVKHGQGLLPSELAADIRALLKRP